MPASVVALLLVSAMLHAAWNLLVKRARVKLVFTWWALVVGFVCTGPVLTIGPRLPLRVWPYVLASAGFEVAYFFTLTCAYDRGDFSLVYPIARGTAPGLLAVWSVLFLGEWPSAGGSVGLALLLVGLVIVGGGAQWVRRSRHGRMPLGIGGAGAAFATAGCISIYSVIDGAAVRSVPPFPYAVIVLGFTALFAAPIVAARFGRPTIIAEWRANWPRIVIVGILSLTTYTVVLIAFTRTRVGYTGAVREVSIVFAAFMGWRLLGEQFGRLRTGGAILIFTGILIIATTG